MHCMEPGEHFAELAVEFGAPYYTRVDTAVTPDQKARYQILSPDSVEGTRLCGDAITAKPTRARGTNAPLDRNVRRARGRRRP